MSRLLEDACDEEEKQDNGERIDAYLYAIVVRQQYRNKSLNASMDASRASVAGESAAFLAGRLTQLRMWKPCTQWQLSNRYMYTCNAYMVGRGGVTLARLLHNRTPIGLPNFLSLLHVHSRSESDFSDLSFSFMSWPSLNALPTYFSSIR